MQNRRVEKIEKAFVIFPANGYIPASLSTSPTVPTPLNTHTKLISTLHFTPVQHMLHNIISAALVISFLARLRQFRQNTTLQTISVATTVLTSHVTPVTDRRWRLDFPVCQLKPNSRPRFQSHYSARVPPIYYYHPINQKNVLTIKVSLPLIHISNHISNNTRR